MNWEEKCWMDSWMDTIMDGWVDGMDKEWN